MKRHLFRVLRWLGLGAAASLGLLSLLLILGYGFVQSESGRQRLVELLNQQLSTPGSSEVRIGRLQGNLLQRIEIHDLSLSDGDGSWLQLKLIAANWRPRDLLNRRLSISNLVIEGLIVSRSPQVTESSGEFEWAGLPLAVSIDRFSLGDTELEQPLLGEKVVLRASGDTVVEGADLVRSTIAITRVDATSGQARLEMKLQPRSRTLELKLDLEEAGGGVITRLLEIEGLPALSIQAHGQGPFDAFQGNVSLQLPGLAFIESHFILAADGQPGLKLEGHSRIEKFNDPRLRKLLTGVLEFSLDGKLKGDTILLQEAVLSSNLARVAVSGSLTGFATEFNLYTSIDDLEPFSELAGIALHGKVNAHTHIVSTNLRRNARVSVKADLAELAAPDNEWLALLGPQLNFDTRFDLKTEQDWQFEEGKVLLENMTITGDPGRVELSGVSNGFAGDFKLAANIKELEPLSEQIGLPLQGKANAQVQVMSVDLRRKASIVVNTNLSELLFPTNEWLTLLGSQVKLDTRLDVDAEQDWQFQDLRVTAKTIELAANGSIASDLTSIDSDYRVLIPQLAVLSDRIGSSIAGELQATGEINGDPLNPALSAHILSKGLQLEKILPGAIEARLNMPQLINKIAGDIELSIDLDQYGEVVLASQFSEQGSDQLKLGHLEIESRNTRLAGDLVLDWPSATLSGKMIGADFALAPWSSLAEHALSGTASVSFDLSNMDKGQGLEINLASSQLGIVLDDQQSLLVDNLQAGAKFDDLFGTLTGGMRLLATNTRISDAELSSVLFEAKMNSPERLSGRLVTRGEFYKPFELALDADYSAREQGYQLDISGLTAMVSGQTVALSKPLQLIQQNGSMTLSQSTLLVADGSLSASAEIDEKHIRALLEVDNISIAALDNLVPTSGVSGSVSGHMLISGSPVAPVGELDMMFDNLQSAHPNLNTTAPVEGRVHGEWLEGRLLLNATLSGATQNSFDAVASVPLLLEPDGFVLNVPPDQAIEGKLNWSGDLEPVWNLLSQQEDRFSGAGEIALVLDGRVENPQIGGFFQVTGGRYENVQSATTLVDVNLRLSGSGDKLVLEELSASDGGSGLLRGSGYVEFLPTEFYPLHMRLELSDMLLVAQDNVSLNASADLTLEGNLADALLSGEIITGQSILNLSGSLPPNVVDLEVEEVNLGSANHAQQRERLATKDSSRLGLDLKISIPGRSFVRGLGLESEWKGELRIEGDSNAPKVAGVLSPVRGRFFLMGKSFRLENGAIRFTGSKDIDPLLDLTAQHSVSSLTALVRITGSATNPKISLTSRPPLPESEIASQVLFGTNSGNLTTAQSLQLASAIASYNGSGGGLGVLDATRRALRVDVINFTDSEENPDKTRVSVGKYISEGVYLEVEGGADRDSRTSTTVEVEVLPNVRFEGGTTETGGNQVGIRWKWDY